MTPPKSTGIIDSKWVLREKEIDRSVKKKARLVERGFRQFSLTENVYAPVARMVTISFIINIL